ncbi:MAG: hypothetical protein Q8O84_01045 [Nanoarchaeota archaeon]|nr:hypothetical protein [Nanoarchaeota archaeon]
MAEIINIENVYREILALRKEVQTIKNHMVEIDVIMTPEEETQLEETLELHKKGKTKRFEDLKKEIAVFDIDKRERELKILNRFPKMSSERAYD